MEQSRELIVELAPQQAVGKRFQFRTNSVKMLGQIVDARGIVDGVMYMENLGPAAVISGAAVFVGNATFREIPGFGEETIDPGTTRKYVFPSAASFGFVSLDNGFPFPATIVFRWTEKLTPEQLEE